MYELTNLSSDKATRYNQMNKQLHSLLEEETDWLANLANTASFLFHSLDDINWSGFYLMKKDELILGPFMGKPACVRIPIGKGVCGTAVAEEKTQLVFDVHQFPGHIACDAASRSEIVLPLRVEGKIIGVLDIDSPSVGRFDEVDKQYLQQLVTTLIDSCDWS
jgi:L-methionine (R)-S-oxide reductase